MSRSGSGEHRDGHAGVHAHRHGQAWGVLGCWVEGSEFGVFHFPKCSGSQSSSSKGRYLFIDLLELW